MRIETAKFTDDGHIYWMGGVYQSNGLLLWWDSYDTERQARAAARQAKLAIRQAEEVARG